MNERIRELAEQARYYIDPDFDIEFEVFAKLIVRECLSNMEDGDLDFAIWKTKKDFGVEE